jgi:Lecithin retinol acyltransferase
MARGDHLVVFRVSPIPFQHHGVDLGDGAVVHFTDGMGGVAAPSSNETGFVIQRTSMQQFVGNSSQRVHVQSYRQRLSVDDTVQRAMSRLGHRDYELFHNNCEHFATWCITGKAESRQVSIAVERGTSVGVKTAVACGVRAATHLGIRSAVRRVSPLLLVADAAQFVTESCGHFVGIQDPQKRQLAGRIVGGTTAVAVGVVGGVPPMERSGRPAKWLATHHVVTWIR